MDKSVSIHRSGGCVVKTPYDDDYGTYQTWGRASQRLNAREQKEAMDCFGTGVKLVEDMVRLRESFHVTEVSWHKYTYPKHHEAYLKAVQRIVPTFRKCAISDLFAFVYPNDTDHVIYLCDQYFNAPADNFGADHEKDSKMGTIMHEMSHFKDVLDTFDICYGKMNRYTLSQYCYDRCGNRTNLENRVRRYSSGETVSWEDVARTNAQNWEYAYERGMRHDGNWSQGRWSCCGCREKVTVCRNKLVFGTEREFGEEVDTTCGHRGKYHVGPRGKMLWQFGRPYCDCYLVCNRVGWDCCGQQSKSKCLKDACARK